MQRWPSSADLRVASQEPKVLHVLGRSPPAYSGPGDAHSIRSGSGGERTIRRCPESSEDAVRLESTPFYLSHVALGTGLPRSLRAEMIVIVRDPIAGRIQLDAIVGGGLEPISDFVEAWRAEDSRVAAGWAPFWHYQRLGRYGEQLADLLGRVERERVLVLRYWQLVSQPKETLNRVAGFLGISEDQVGMIPPDNARPFVEPGVRTSVLGRVIRAGAGAAAYLPPHAWRRASKPLVSLLQHGGAAQRPKLAPEQRTALLGDCVDDIALLEQTLGESFEDWRSEVGRGSFAERAAKPQS